MRPNWQSDVAAPVASPASLFSRRCMGVARNPGACCRWPAQAGAPRVAALTESNAEEMMPCPPEILPRRIVWGLSMLAYPNHYSPSSQGDVPPLPGVLGRETTVDATRNCIKSLLRSKDNRCLSVLQESACARGACGRVSRDVFTHCRLGSTGAAEASLASSAGLAFQSVHPIVPLAGALPGWADAPKIRARVGSACPGRMYIHRACQTSTDLITHASILRRLTDCLNHHKGAKTPTPASNNGWTN